MDLEIIRSSKTSQPQKDKNKHVFCHMHNLDFFLKGDMQLEEGLFGGEKRDQQEGRGKKKGT
jgi:hypothetical protein